MNLFGIKRHAPTIKISDAIATSRAAQETLSKRVKHLEKLITQVSTELHEKLKKKDRNGAKHLLQKRKNHEKYLDQALGMLNNLDQQTTMVENIPVLQEYVRANEANKNAMEQYVNDEELERAQKTQDQLKDLMQQADEYGNLLAQPINQYADDDLDEEIEKMCQDMEAEEMEQQLSSVRDIPRNVIRPHQQHEEKKEVYPPRPAAKPQKKEDKELEEFQRMMAI